MPSVILPLKPAQKTPALVPEEHGEKPKYSRKDRKQHYYLQK